MIYLIGPKDKAPNDAKVINTTSRSDNWSRYLSPFYLGPVDLYSGFVAQNVENAWQYSKVYEEFVDYYGDPTAKYYLWASEGWAKKRANRYPMGKGRKPLYSIWDQQRFNYTEARKKIYAPLYSKAVENTAAFKWLRGYFERSENLYLWDFDVYDHRKLGMSYKDVINCETKKMGHAFVLAMLLENQRVWEDK